MESNASRYLRARVIAEIGFRGADETLQKIEGEISRARKGCAECEEIIQGVTYVEGADPPEVVDSLRMAEVGIRHYGRQIEAWQAARQAYFELRGQMIADWKKNNSCLRRGA